MGDRPLQILLIEDDPEDARLVTRILSKAEDVPCEVTHVGCLKDGMERMAGRGEGGKKDQIDLVLTDLSLPDSQGVDSFKEIHRTSPEVPIIVLSGMNDRETATELVQQGAQDFLVKGSVNADLLIRSIRYAIERKRVQQMKDQFISTVSHELRTPLAIVMAAIDNLRARLFGPLQEKQAPVLELVYQNINRLGRMINDLLDLSRLESGKAKIRMSRLAPATVLPGLLQGFEMAAKERHLILRPDLAAGLPDLCADSDLIQRVLTNLLDNALRYARKEVVVRMRVPENGGSSVRISVIDDGPGIAQEDLPRLFNKFEQVNRPTGGRGYKGTGLGLAICKEIVDQHHGKIWVESRLGSGTEFHCELPCWRE